MLFSLPKILALIGVIGGVWYGFRLLEAYRSSRQDAADDSTGNDTGSTHKKSGPLDRKNAVYVMRGLPARHVAARPAPILADPYSG